MPATVIRLDSRPVVVTTFFEPLETGCVLEAYVRAAELSARMGGKVFWMVDLRGTDDSFVEIADLWLDIAKGFSGSAVTPGLNAAFVGLPAMSEYFDELNLPFFREVNEAIAMLHITPMPHMHSA